MECPFCGHSDFKVTDSRNAVEANAIRRRRECLKCMRRFTTFETVELIIQVHKRDGRYEDFQQQKLINGIEAACRHTKISRDQVNVLVANIVAELMERQVRDITTKELGEVVMKYLQPLDSIAYIRFACVYKRFQDINELVEAIQSIIPKDEQDLANMLPLQGDSMLEKETILCL
ncbi:MAG: transcriptional regulator NrdR [Chlamydiales bacterium]|nr:transcriptional regulator NrdR [Chlamydiales bacterium]